MAPPKPDLKLIPRIKHPAFSSESSETEYTSASSDEEDNSNQRTPIKGPVERYEVDKSGKRILVVDLGDSDDDIEAAAAPPKPQPLCLSCEKLKRLEPPKVVEKDVKIVVDLSAQTQALSSEANGKQAPLKACGKQAVEANTISLKANGRQVVAKVEAQAVVSVEANGKQVDTETVSLRANGKQVEAKAKATTVSLKANGMGASTVSLKANGKQIEVDFRNEKVKPVANGKLAEGKAKTTRSLVHVKHTTPQGVKESIVKVKESIVKVRETVLSTPEESEDEASTLSEDYRRGSLRVDRYRPDWSPSVVCDLCERGPSLYLGAWYSWCCGNPSRGCSCPIDEIQRRKKAMLGKGGKYRKPGEPPYSWSGKVHKLCGLWSGEVYEDERHTWRIKKLSDAVRRSRKLRCSDPECGLFGATLGCRVSSCKRSFHYPCADRLAALVQVRMWDGMLKPVACKEHLQFAEVFDDLKLPRETKKESKKESKKRKRGKSAAGTSKAAAAAAAAAGIIEIESSDDEETVPTTRIVDNTDRGRNAAPAYFGKNLLCRDFSNGLEPIQVPCTNDVDHEEPPYLEYITKSRYKGQPLGSRNCPPLLMQRPAVACDGCARHDPDDPMAPMSAHIPFHRREDDFREDWLNERMYGRLPYDKYARLVIGTDYNELVECNERCKCGNECINKEMQRGLRTPIELYKTENKGWAVRTLVPIPRGKFVIEYVGEMLGQDKAQECGQIYDGLKRSYLYDLDYPESKRTPVFTLDGFHASNVARFINHSCDANLKIYRVFVETTYKWLSHIGMYAMRDIAPGEELSYDYNYGRHDLQTHEGKAEAKAEQQNDSTHIKCYCGAQKCREWLWRPMHTGDDSDEEI